MGPTTATQGLHMNLIEGFADNGPRIRKALQRFGPLFVKFGQLLSTRADLLPTPILQELCLLQDQAPPFSSTIAQQILEKEFKQPIHEIFKHFDTKPLASASIAQVHQATLHNDEKVAVKILRPKIRKQIKRNIALLKIIARLLEGCSKKIRLFKLCAMVNEFEKTLYQEIDLLKEAANASQLRRQFKNSNLFYVPRVDGNYTRHTILVTELIVGIPLSQMDAFKKQNFNLQKISESLIEVFFIQVFKNCFFHADLHPGNLFISLETPPRLIAVDFGIMGSLSPTDQQYLAQNILAFLNRDYRQVAILHLECGWIPANTRIDEFESSIRAICEPMFECPEGAVSFGTLLLQLFRMAQEHHVNIQPQLLLFQKSVFYVESLSRQLYPDINLWQVAKPFLEQWLKEQVGLNAMTRLLKQEVPRLIQRFLIGVF